MCPRVGRPCYRFTRPREMLTPTPTWTGARLARRMEMRLVIRDALEIERRVRCSAHLNFAPRRGGHGMRRHVGSVHADL